MSTLIFIICIVYRKRAKLFFSKRTLYLHVLHFPEGAIHLHSLHLFSLSKVAGMNTVNIPTTAPAQNSS